MASDLAPLFNSRDTRNSHLPEGTREAFTELESNSLDPEFGDRHFSAVWLARKTGATREEVIHNYDAVSSQFFGKDTTPSQHYDAITEGYKFETAQAKEEEEAAIPEAKDAPYVPKAVFPRMGKGFMSVNGMEQMNGGGFDLDKGIRATPDIAAKAVSESSSILYKTLSGVYSQASAATGIPQRKDMKDVKGYEEMSVEKHNLMAIPSDELFAAAIDGPPVATEEQTERVAAIDAKQRAMVQKVDREHREDVRRWLASDVMKPVSDAWRESSNYILDMADHMDEAYHVDPEFAQSTTGIVAGYVGSLPTTVAIAVIPYFGLPLVESLMFTEIEQDRKDVEGEDYNPEAALLQNVGTASAQAALERAFGVERVLSKALFGIPKRGGKVMFLDYVKNFLKTGSMSMIEEGLTEPSQGAVQDFMASITFDEGRDWIDGDAAKRRLMEMLVGAAGGLLMGGGISTLTTGDQHRAVNRGIEYLTTKDGELWSPGEFRVLRASKSDEEIKAYGVTEEMSKMMLDAANGDVAAQDEINKIVADELFVETDGIELEGPKVEGNLNGSQLGMIEGSIFFKTKDGNYHELDMSNPEQAAFVEHYKSQIASQIRQQARNETAEFMASRLEEGRSIVVEEETHRVLMDEVDEQKISMKEALERMAVARDVNKQNLSMDPKMAQILGNNDGEYANGVWSDVSKVYMHSTPLDVVEEISEGYIKKRLALRDLDESELLAWKQKYEADTGNVAKGNDKVSLIEWFSKRVVDYAVGNRKQLGMPKSWGAFLRTLGDHLKTVLSLATKMKGLQRDGKLAPEFETAMKEALGIVPSGTTEAQAKAAHAKRQEEFEETFGPTKPDEAERESPEGAERINYDLRRQEAEARADAAVKAQLSAQAERVEEELDKFGPTFSMMPANVPFYSQLESVLEAKFGGQKVATIQQVMGAIDPIKGSGVAQEEIKWSGIEEAAQNNADRNGGKVNIAELKHYMATDGRLAMQENYLGMGPPISAKERKAGLDRLARMTRIYDAANERTDTAKQNRARARDKATEARSSATNDWLDANPEPADSAKTSEEWHEWHREKFAFLDETHTQLIAEMEPFEDAVQSTREAKNIAYRNMEKADRATSSRAALQAKFSGWITPGPHQGYGEHQLVVDDDFVYRNHFEELGIFAHSRVTLRTDATGAEGLLIEELQSDRHQHGRKGGYSTIETRAATTKLKAKAQSLHNKAKNIWLERDTVTKEMARIEEAHPGGRAALGMIQFGADTVTEEAYRWKNLYWKSDDLAEEHEKIIKEYNAIWENSLKADAGLTLDGPFRKDWPLQMFKRELRDAIIAGKEWIGWTPGEEQARRYKMSASIDSVTVYPDEGIDGSLGLTVTPKGARQPFDIDFEDGRVPDGDDEFSGLTVEEIFGTDLAASIIAESKDPDNQGGVIQGDGLDVGAPKLKKFYDKDLPRDIGKYVKKFKGKVGVGQLEGEGGSFVIDITHKGTVVHTVEGRPDTIDEDAMQWIKDNHYPYEGGLSAATRAIPELLDFWKIQITPDMKVKLESKGMTTFSMSPVDTPAFKQWFKDSKAVNEDGSPMVMFHGTESNFTEFRRGMRFFAGFFSTDPEFANDFATTKEGANMMPVYVSAQNPFDFRDPEHRQILYKSEGWRIYHEQRNNSGRTLDDYKEAVAEGAWYRIEPFAHMMPNMGFDGAWVMESGIDREADESIDVLNIGVFRPTQIKSAIGNNGDFDPLSGNITFSLASVGEVATESTDAHATSTNPTAPSPKGTTDAQGRDAGSKFRVSPASRGRGFFEALERTRKEHPQGAAVAVYPVETYLNPENLLFQSYDRQGGVMVTAEGDLQSVHKIPGSKANMKEVLAEASGYAVTLDAFDIGGFLPKLYGQFGFVPVARVKFDRSEAPPNWNYEKLGEPDVVLMVNDTAGALKSFEPVTFTDFPAAAQVQQNAKEMVAAAHQKQVDASSTFSMVQLAEQSDEYDVSRIGTAVQGKNDPTTQGNNVGASSLTPEGLAKHMAKMTHFLDGYPMPDYILKHTDPVKRMNALLKMMTDNLIALHDAFPAEYRDRATHWYDGARLIADFISNEYGLSPEQGAGIMSAFSPRKDWFQNVQLALNFADVFANERDTVITKETQGEALTEILASATDAAKKARRKIIKGITGKTVNQLWKAGDVSLATWAVRVLSQQKHGLEYDILAPEGFRLDPATNDGGGTSTLVWQGSVFIHKALEIAFNGTGANISKWMGVKHKIRSFFNNIIAPNSPYGDVTSDTHNVNATFLFPTAGDGLQAAMNFGTAGTGGGGNRGTYWLHQEAVRMAAAAISKRDGRTIQPRQMQSITWEAVRLLFPDKLKGGAGFIDKIGQIWQKSKNASQARKQILAEPIGDPDWAPKREAGADSGTEEIQEGAGTRPDPKRGARPRLRQGSAAGDDGVGGVTFSLTEETGLTYELSGVPITKEQMLQARYERITAKRLAASADLINRQKRGLDIPARVKQARKTSEASISANLLVPISGRLQRIDRNLAQRLRRFEFDVGMAVKGDLDKVTPFLEGMQGMAKDDAQLLDLALKNSDTATRDTLLKAYNMVEAYAAVEEVLADARKRGVAAGYEIGELENYFPRKVIDHDGLRAHYSGDPVVSGAIDIAISEAVAKARSDGRELTYDERLEVVNRTLQRVNRTASKPGNFKGRITDVVSVDASQFYSDSATALVGYIESTNQAVEKRRFFGNFVVDAPAVIGATKKTMALDASIGALVDGLVAAGHIDAKQQAEVISILEARFNYAVANSKIKKFKTLGYMSAMGQFTSAITQFGDLTFSLFENGAFNTMIEASKAFVRQSEITREAMGIENVAQEFAGDVTMLSRLMNGIFAATGLRYIDMVGKETMVNAKMRRMRQEAKKGKLSEKTQLILDTSFTPEQAAQVVEDLIAGNVTPDTMFAVYSVLADYQPISLSEYPQGYLENPKGRMFYMLKTFTLKQIESFRREGLDDIINGNVQQKAAGFRKLIHLAGLFYMANIPVDWIKDWLMGRDPQLSDLMVDNLFKLVGISRWHVWNFRYRKNVVEFGLQLVAPAAPFLQYPAMDLVESLEKLSEGEEIKPGQFHSWRIIPLVGSPIYWHLGGGATKIEKRRKERESL